MGILFIVLSAACVLLAATLISWDTRLVYALSATTCALAVLGYAATRITAFPMLADDKGNWLEPLGLTAITAEAVAVITALAILRSPSSGTSRQTIGTQAHPFTHR